MKRKPLQLITVQIYSREDPTSKEALDLRNQRLPAKQEEALSIGKRYYTDFSERLLRFIANYDNGFYCPEKCDVCEPIREIFDTKDLSAPIHWLSQPSGRVMVKKSKTFRYEGFVENHRFPNFWDDWTSPAQKLVRDPVFITEWCLWFQSRVLNYKSLDQFRQFFWDLCEVTEADYGFFTMEEDHKQKNYLITPLPDGVSMKFVGDNLEVCLPGIYFGNYFGPLYVNFFGEERFASAPCAFSKQLGEETWYLQCSDTLDYYKQSGALNYADALLDYLGRDAFFDIRDIMRRCRVPEYVRLNRRRDDPLSF